MAGAAQLISWLRAEWGSLTRFNRSDRRWPMPFAAALSSGLPLLVGASFGHLDYGLISSLGGMHFLYLPETPMYHLMAASIGAHTPGGILDVPLKVGLLLAWGVLLLPLSAWTIPLVMIALAFCIEMLVVRHYALAAIFITPLSILLVEAATLGQTSPAPLIAARFWDTVLGCLVGLLGCVCLHSPRFRATISPLLRRLLPTGLTSPPPTP